MHFCVNGRINLFASNPQRLLYITTINPQNLSVTFYATPKHIIAQRRVEKDVFEKLTWRAGP